MSIRTLMAGLAIHLLMAVSALGVELTEAERLYVKQVGPVNFCVDPDWAPFERVDDAGRHVGIAADLLALVTKDITEQTASRQHQFRATPCSSPRENFFWCTNSFQSKARPCPKKI